MPKQPCENPSRCEGFETTKKMILNESDDNEQFTKFELKNVLNKC